MLLVINGVKTDVTCTKTLDDVLLYLGYGKDPFVSVALNQTCIPRHHLPTTYVQEGDDVEILAPTQGG